MTNRIARKTLALFMFFALSAPLACCESSHASTTPDGGVAPSFRLSTYDGGEVSLDDFADKIVVLEWFAHDCEFTRSHYRKGEGHMQKLQAEFGKRGVVWLTIDSNGNALPAEEMKELASEWRIQSAAFLSDPDGKVGRAYGVTTTPQMFVIERGNIVYQGAIDDRSGFLGLLRDRSTAHSYVRQALEERLRGDPVSTPETKPYGCKIRYAE